MIDSLPEGGVILASASPRRRELLTELLGSVKFEILAADLDEQIYLGEAPETAAERLASEKARAIHLLRPNSLIIAADTIVFLPRKEGALMFGKPKDHADAVQTLLTLSGKTHRVVTGVAIQSPVKLVLLSDVSEVVFRDLTRDEVETYVAGGEPMDKAGGYALQGDGAAFVVEVRGYRSTVIGLPVERLKAEMGFNG